MENSGFRRTELKCHPYNFNNDARGAAGYVSE
jgi:hypothetical protein